MVKIDKKFRLEKQDIGKHDISSLLKNEDITNIEYVDVQVLDFAVVMSMKYTDDFIEKEKKAKKEKEDKDNKDKKIPIDK